jgi:protein-tyrosine phosphatase
MSFGSLGPDCSWITDNLAVSGAIRKDHFVDIAIMDIQAIVDVRSETQDDSELLENFNIEYLNVPVLNRYSPPQDQLDSSTAWIYKRFESDVKILIHCQEGIGRSVTLTCAVLMLHGYTLKGSIQLVHSKRWGVHLNKRQIPELLLFAQRNNIALE